MHHQVVRFPVSEALTSSDSGLFIIGYVVESNEQHILIDYPGNLLGPVSARSAVAIPEVLEQEPARTTQVILVFERGDLSLPFIIGIISNGQQFLDSTKEVVTQDIEERVVLDANSLILSGRKEVILQCGKGSITLREDGKIVIKGVELVSRASHSNKIKGITVNIN